jgi:hypothetical protein
MHDDRTLIAPSVKVSVLTNPTQLNRIRLLLDLVVWYKKI